MIKYIKNNDYLKLFQKMFGTSLINVYIEKPKFNYSTPFSTLNTDWIDVDDHLVLEFDSGTCLKIGSYVNGEDPEVNFQMLSTEDFRTLLEK